MEQTDVCTGKEEEVTQSEVQQEEGQQAKQTEQESELLVTEQTERNSQEGEGEQKEGDLGTNGNNPLVMEERTKNASKNKKKKGAASGASKEKPTSTLDLINAKLKELEKREKETKSPVPVGIPGPQDSHQEGLRLLTEGGEKLLREAFQKCIGETKKVERDHLLLKRRNEQITKEKDKLQLEAKELKISQQREQAKCRDLQKHIKTLKELAVKMEAEKEAQRNDLEGRLQSAIQEITDKIKEGTDEREKLCKENAELQEKIQELEKDYEEKLDKYKNLNMEKSELLVTKKQTQHEEELVATGERQKSQLCEEALRLTSRSCQDLRMQIKIYKERMTEFEDSIQKSQSVFSTFGKELVKMKDHETLLTEARDAAKQELSDMQKKMQELSDRKVAQRKQVTQQTALNTKQKEAANRLATKRTQWRPFEQQIAAWLETKKPVPPRSPNTHQDPAAPVKQTPGAAEEEKENTPPTTA